MSGNVIAVPLLLLVTSISDVEKETANFTCKQCCQMSTDKVPILIADEQPWTEEISCMEVSPLLIQMSIEKKQDLHNKIS
jgi:hypothetical protein